MSLKRIKQNRERDLSTSVINIDGDLSTLITFNSVGGNDEINVNHSGEAIIVQRDANFVERPVYISWSQTLNMVSPDADGLLLVLVNSSGNIELQNVDSLAKLPPIGTFNSNDYVQIGAFVIVAGDITQTGPLIQYSGNMGNRLAYFMDYLGEVNSKTDSISTEIIPATLNMEIIGGSAVNRSVSSNLSEFTKRPDIDELAGINPATIALITRDNIIQSFGLVMNVDDYEDPNNPGTLIALGNNKAANKFTVVFPGGGFIGLQLGQVEYSSTILAINSGENSDFSNIFGSSLPDKQLAIEEGETDLSNALIRQLPRIL